MLFHSFSRLYCWRGHTFKWVGILGVCFNRWDYKENRVSTRQAPSLPEHLRSKRWWGAHVCVYRRLSWWLALLGGGWRRYRAWFKWKFEESREAVWHFLHPTFSRAGAKAERAWVWWLIGVEREVWCSLYCLWLARDTCIHFGARNFLRRMPLIATILQNGVFFKTSHESYSIFDQPPWGGVCPRDEAAVSGHALESCQVYAYCPFFSHYFLCVCAHWKYFFLSGINTLNCSYGVNLWTDYLCCELSIIMGWFLWRYIYPILWDGFFEDMMDFFLLWRFMGWASTRT